MSANSSGSPTPNWLQFLTIAALIATVLGTIIAYLAYIKPSSQPSPTPTPPISITTPTPAPTNTPTSIPTDTPAPTTVVGQSSYGSTATETMDAFCTDLYNQDYQAAYTLFSNSFQANYGPESHFAYEYASSQCGQNFGATPHGNGQQYPVYIVYPTRTYLCTYYLFQDNNGGWEIYSIYCR